MNPESPAEDRKEDAKTRKAGAIRLPANSWIYFTFFALVCAFFYDSLFLGRVILTRDTFVDFIPRLEFARSAYRDFAVPLWNPQTGCGHPFLADPYMGAAYPLNFLFYVLPVTWAYRLTMVFHLALAGFGMIALARHWGLRPSAALICAICFVFGTHTIAMMEFFNAIYPLSWGPLIVYLGCLLYDRSLRHSPGEGLRSMLRGFISNWHLIAILAGCLTLAYLGGNPQYLSFALLLVGGYFVARLIYDRKIKAVALAAAMFAAAGTLALLLSAPQLLPFLELLEHSFRSAAIDPGYDQGSVHPSHLLTFFLPYLFGSPGPPEAYWAETILEFELGAFYVGLLPLIAALFALRAFREKEIENRRWIRFLAVLLLTCSIAAWLMAAGKHLPVYETMLGIVPGLDKLRWPSKFMLLVTYAIPLLGGLGFHVLLERKAKGESHFRFEWSVLATFVALPLVALAGRDLIELFEALVGSGVDATAERQTLFRRDLVTALLFLGITIAGLTGLIAAKNAKQIRLLEYALVAAVFLNLAVISRQVHPISRDNPYLFNPTTWETLRSAGASTSDDPHWRIYSNYVFNAFSLYGVSDPDIFKLAKKVSVGETWLPSGIPRVCNSALGISRYYEFYELIRAAPPEIADRFLDLLNVRFIIGGPPWEELTKLGLNAQITVFPRDTLLPRAFLTASWRAVDDFESGLRTLGSPNFDVRSEILLEPSADGEMPALASAPAAPVGGTVGGIRYDWNRVEMRVSAPQPGLLVLNDTWYPGWKASVNGIGRPIFRANLLFRAIEVPAGESEIVFAYDPPQGKLGLLLAGIGLLIIGGGFFCERRFDSRQSGPSP